MDILEYWPRVLGTGSWQDLGSVSQNSWCLYLPSPLEKVTWFFPRDQCEAEVGQRMGWSVSMK